MATKKSAKHHNAKRRIQSIPIATPPQEQQVSQLNSTIPVTEQSKPQEKNSLVKKGISVLVALVALIGFYAIGYLAVHYLLNGNNNSATGVHINGIIYHYYDPQTNYSWTYTLPENYNLGLGSTLNGTFPFTDNITCSMTMSQIYATTPGFTFSFEKTPIILEPGETKEITVILTAPPYQYSGPLNVNATVTYGPGC